MGSRKSRQPLHWRTQWGRESQAKYQMCCLVVFSPVLPVKQALLIKWKDGRGWVTQYSTSQPWKCLSSPLPNRAPSSSPEASTQLEQQLLGGKSFYRTLPNLGVYQSQTRFKIGQVWLQRHEQHFSTGWEGTYVKQTDLLLFKGMAFPAKHRRPPCFWGLRAPEWGKITKWQ